MTWETLKLFLGEFVFLLNINYEKVYVAFIRPLWTESVCLQVKFMKSVPGTALVEMGDEYAVDRAITHLNSIKVFGKRINVW